jgi:cytidine deaminase
MKQLQATFTFDQLDFDELSTEERRLIESAIKATENSYAPYSNFRVGAAVALDDDTIVVGANQENAAYPSGLCAERTALFAAQAQHPTRPVTMLAIAARNEDGPVAQPITPCGACRQVIAGVEERYGKPMEILLYGTSCIYRIHSAKDLMPLAFADSSMR